MAKEKERERERGKEKHRKEERERRQNGFFPLSLSLLSLSLLSLSSLLSLLLSFSLPLLLPVKQLLMICRQMVSGRSFFPRLALLQTGGWERSTKSYLPFLFEVEKVVPIPVCHMGVAALSSMSSMSYKYSMAKKVIYFLGCEKNIGKGRKETGTEGKA